MSMINVASWRPCTTVEGPYKRFALWVQGCLTNCHNCCNPQMQPLVPQNIFHPEEVLTMITEAKEKYDIEGITLLGGEPFLQATGLAELTATCQKINLGVITFSGYTLEQIKQQNLPGSKELLANSDLLIDGPYLEDKPEDERNWAGSKNQKFHYFTNRYSPNMERDPQYKHAMEIMISTDTIKFNGWPYLDLNNE